MSAKKANAPEPEQVETEQFEKALAEEGLAGFFRNVHERPDMSVEVFTTGLPRLDKVLHSKKLGMPRGRWVEFYSKDPEVGKTSATMQIGATCQHNGMKVAIVDIEDTITDELLEISGFVLDPPARSGMFPVYLAKGYNEDTGEVLTAEEIMDKVVKISKIVDLVIIDSMAALAKKADLERDPGDAAQPGGIGKIMYDARRKLGKARATAFWINQALAQIGGYNPTGQTRYKTTGGQAVPFFASIRLELRVVEKLKDKNDNVYGMKVDFYTAKNKVSPPFKHVVLTYINGRGFCPIYDTFEAAKAAGVIEKSGAWLKFGDTKVQGDLEFYKRMTEEKDLLKAVQEALKQEGEEQAA